MQCTFTACFALLAMAFLPALQAQMVSPRGPLDPSQAIAVPRTVSSYHQPLPEQYIWTAGDATSFKVPKMPKAVAASYKTAPHYFRDAFPLHSVPQHATLYLAGPRSARVYINGQLAADLQPAHTNRMVFTTLTVNAQPYLHAGTNVIALQVVRGWGVHHHTNSLLTSQLNFGQILAVKLVPAVEGVDAPALLLSGPAWKSTLQPGEGWQQPAYDDSAWPPVQTLGSIEGDTDFFQWNADAGLYAWPGYLGEAPYMANYHMPPLRIASTLGPQGALHHEDALLHLHPATLPASFFQVDADAVPAKDAVIPGLMLDFGREVTGRIELRSASSFPEIVTVQYGESIGEAEHAPFLGTDSVTIPAQGTAFGPKSAFRYALIRFPQNQHPFLFRQILVDGIYYPVRHLGAFQSSDKLLNRIWETSAYTAHLCMQDSIWDAPKRDRGRWMGDMEVMDRTINTAFYDSSLVEKNFDLLIGPAPVQEQVNTIPGYSAFWVIGLAEFYRNHDAVPFVENLHGRLLQLLTLMDKEVDQRNLYAHLTGGTGFVDWSPELSSDTPESRRALQFEFILAYREAAWLLRLQGDTVHADYWNQRAQALDVAAQQYLLDQSTNTFGPLWQTNAMAILAGATTAAQDQAIWSRIFSRVADVKQPHQVITPYYGYYLLEAMARIGHRHEALDWMREYWGGMLDEGATSFWEAYDPAWPKKNFHRWLQADGKTGYYVSLAHGWSSGPAAWLTEQILGVRPLTPGFQTVQIRPNLAGLTWAQGSVPTPHGVLRIAMRKQAHAFHMTLDLPPQMVATLLLPASSSNQRILVNGVRQTASPAEDHTRQELQLSRSGHYIIQLR
ncbi:MAG: alpha-L-rhamnosidase-related protein [Acidobacteriaceae bacterium]